MRTRWAASMLIDSQHTIMSIIDRANPARARQAVIDPPSDSIDAKARVAKRSVASAPRRSGGYHSGMNDRVVPSGKDSSDDSDGHGSDGHGTNGPKVRNLRPETMGQLAGQLAHDFNNVLAVTLTSVEVAMRVGDPAKATGFLTQCNRSHQTRTCADRPSRSRFARLRNTNER